MTIIHFDKDEDYCKWIADNPDGFVVNTRRPYSPSYMVLHMASCKDISEPSHEKTPGGFAERQYAKVGSLDIESLRQWAKENGRDDGSFTTECGHCKPTTG